MFLTSQRQPGLGFTTDVYVVTISNHIFLSQEILQGFFNKEALRVIKFLAVVALMFYSTKWSRFR